MSETTSVVKTMPLSDFATRRTEVKRHILKGGVVHLTDRGEHVMSITPPEAGKEYEKQRTQEVADFEAFKAARMANASTTQEEVAG